MKKLLAWTAGTLLILCLAVYLLTNGWDQPVSYKTSKLAYDPSMPVTLDFENAHIRVYSDEDAANGQDYIEVRAFENSRGEKAQYKLDLSLNTAKLEQYQLSLGQESRKVSYYRIGTWIPLVQFDRYKEQASGSGAVERNDFVVRVPRDAAVNIRAESMTVKNCRINSAKGDLAQFEKCTLLENFEGEGSRLEMEKCTIEKGASFQYEQIRQNSNITVD